MPARNFSLLAIFGTLYQSWSDCFMYDIFTCGNCLHTFIDVNYFNHEELSIQIDVNLPAKRMVSVLDRIAASQGYPAMPRMGNGTNFIVPTINKREEMPAVRLGFMKSGKPAQKAFIERFHGAYITERVDCYMHRSLNELRKSRIGSCTYITSNVRMNH